MKQLALFFLFLLSTFASAKQVPIVILHTTDLHAHILPSTNYEGEKNLGGVARCSHAITEERKKNANILLVDAGDIYQGSAVGYYTQGSIMTRVLSLLKYDVWTLGNHEFDWGIHTVSERVNETKTSVLGANLLYLPLPDSNHTAVTAFAQIKPFIIREISGVKIGIVGLTTPGIPSWSRPQLVPGLHVHDSVQTLKKVIPQLKHEKCDIIILVTHQGYREQGDDHASQITAITQQFPEIDVIIGGHTHREIPAKMLNGILYTQAGYWGGALGKVELLYDQTNHRLASKHSELLKMDESVPMDESLLKELKVNLDSTEVRLSEKVGEAADSILAITGPKKETPVFNLLCASISEALANRGEKIDGVVHGILNDRAGFKKGPIYLRDVFEIVPYENTIGTVSLSRDQLLEILEENAGTYQTHSFRGLWGMTLKLSPSAPAGKRVLFLGDQNSLSLDATKKFRIAFNSYDLASGGRRWNRLREIVDLPNSQLKEYDFQTRDAVVEYIKKHSPLTPEIHGWWTIEKNQRTP